jgi:hypothetical protein
MGLIFRSARALVLLVSVPSLVSANTIGIVVRHSLATLSTGWAPAHALPLILRIFLTDMGVRSTIGYLKVSVKRGRRLAIPPTAVTSGVTPQF